MMPMDQVNSQDNTWPKNMDIPRQPTAGFPVQPLTNQGPSFGMAPPTFPLKQNQATKAPRPAGKKYISPAINTDKFEP